MGSLERLSSSYSNRGGDDEEQQRLLSTRQDTEKSELNENGYQSVRFAPEEGQVEEEKQEEEEVEDDDDDDDDDDDEGPPSLTAAFRSVENRPILRLCAMYLAIYLGVAVLAFSFIFEKWSIIDSLYFAVSTFTTCGYGDHEPTTQAGQLFTIFFAIYGVIILGVFIGIVGNFISEHQYEVTLNNEEEFGEQVLETLFAGIDEKEKPGNTRSPRPKPTYQEVRKDFLGDHISLADDFWFVVKSEYKAIALVAVGGLILGLREGWGITSILYFCIMAASTTGYGDYTPQTQTDKVFCIFFYPLAVCVFGEVLARIAGVYMQRRRVAAEKEFLHQALTLCDLRKMDADQDGSVSKEEFICYMLVALQKVDQEVIDDLREIFDKFDTTGSGTLEKSDLIKRTKKNYKPLLKIKEELKEELEEEMAQMTEWPSLFATPILPRIDNGSSSTDGDSSGPRHRRCNTVA